MTERAIGTVTHYWTNLHVAGVTITGGELHTGDHIRIRGATSDFEQDVGSMELDHEHIETAHDGDKIGLVVSEHVRENDTVYMVC